MSYSLGVDLGTSYTAAATERNGRVDIANLGNQSATIPSVVLLKEDQTILTGEAADRRGITEPDRVAREFKRRVGDTTPIFLGGAPQSAEALMGRLLRWVADEVAQREGGPADRLAVCHPANWGAYKQDLLRQAVRIADLGTAILLTEPEAAAIHYASLQRVETGAVVAVYDLGGGTFDAAILRKTEDGFEILGEPEGIERLGGIDFDAAVFAHVVRSLGGVFGELDEDDPGTIAAVARLRSECTAAKEVLSSDTDVSIPVLLPSLQTEVRLTRAEFESMIRPSLADSIAALRRALASAKVDVADVATVLLVGGSSRIPLVAQIVGAEIGRPVAVDAHPKHSIALGAALAASAQVPAAADPVVPAPIASAVAAPVVAAAVTGVAATAAIPQVLSGDAGGSVPQSFAPESLVPAPDSSDGNRLKIIAAAAAACLVVGVGAFVLLSGGGDSGDATSLTATTIATPVAPVTTVAPETTLAPETTVAPETTLAPETTVAPANPQDAVAAAERVSTLNWSAIAAEINGQSVTLTGRAFDEPARQAILSAASLPGVDVVDDMELQEADEQCTESIRALENWTCILDATWDGSTVRATYNGSPNFGGAPYDLSSSHLHVFGSNVPVIGAGVPGPFSDGSGVWQVWDDPAEYDGTLAAIGSPDGVPEKICARIATSAHTLESLESGNCWPITQPA